MDEVDIQEDSKGKVRIGFITTYRTLLLAGVSLIGYFQYLQKQSSEQDHRSNIEILDRINKIEDKLTSYQNTTSEKLFENKLSIAALQQDLNDTKERYIWNNPAFKNNER